MTLTAPKGIIFDWDNTLVDTWVVIHYALEVTFVEMGHEPWTLEQTQARVRTSAREAFPRLFGDRSERAMKIFYEAFESHHLEKLVAHDGAETMLANLKVRDILLSILSNKQGYLLRREIEHLGWGRYFHSLVGANDAARDKPALEAVELALVDSGLDRSEDVWFVGDTDIDVECALRAGCRPVLLRPRPPEPDEFPDAPDLLYVADCPSFLALVEAA